MMAGYYAIPGLIAGANLKTNQYKAVRFSSTVNRTVLAISNANAQRPIGVQQDEPDTGEPINVASFGVAKMEAGSTIVRGAKIAMNNAGEAISDAEVTTGGAVDLHHFGIALDSAADGDIFDIYIFPAERIGSE